MDHLFDEFSKSLAEPLPRRESLRRLGAVFAGAVLSPLAAGTAWAAGKPAPDPCKAFCKCRNKSQQNQCLAACSTCNGNTSNLCGSCDSYVCIDLLNDFDNCGACGNSCPDPGPYEDGACINGRCAYTCLPDTVRCNGTCTDLGSDPDNCGACGYECGGATPYCAGGNCVTCEAVGLTNCNGTCKTLNWDPNNCGACGNVCVGETHCLDGVCAECAPGLTLCGGIYCVDLLWNNSNCGACFHQCAGNEYCGNGICQGI